MQFLSERIETAIEAVTLRRLLAISSFAAAASGAIWGWEHIVPYLTERGMTGLAGIPIWAIGAFVFLLCALGSVFEYAHRLRISIRPKLRLSFNQDIGGIVETPLKFWTPQSDGTRLLTGEVTCSYLRVHADATSKKPVRECTAFLTGIEKKAPGDTVFKVVPLSYAVQLAGQQEFRVLPNVTRTIDFMTCRHDNNLLLLDGSWPLTLRNAFVDRATYRLTICVNGDGVSETVKVDVNWAGSAQTITAFQSPALQGSAG